MDNESPVKDPSGQISYQPIPTPTDACLNISASRNCHHVIELASQKIGPYLLHLLPLDMMKRLQVVPFDYNAEDGLLKVACSTASDRQTAEEISAFMQGIDVDLYQAKSDEMMKLLLELSNSADETTNDKGTIMENLHPLTAASGTDSNHSVEAVEGEDTEKDGDSLSDERPFRGRVLFITPRGKISEHFAFALRVESYGHHVVDSAIAGQQLIQTEPFASIFIHDSFENSSGPLIGMIHKCQPTARICFYGTEADILINDTQDELVHDLLRKNLLLIKHLDGRADGMFSTHASSVAGIAEAVCISLHLPPQHTLAIFTAASLHNLAETSLTSIEPFKPQDVIALSASRLESWGYHPRIVALMRAMYKELTPVQKRCPDLNVIGASILSGVDFYCHAMQYSEMPSADCVCRLKESLILKCGNFVLPEIIDELIGVISAGMDRGAAALLFDVHTLTPRETLPIRLADSLSVIGFEVTYSHSVEDCSDRCLRRRPQVLLLYKDNTGRHIDDLVLQLAFRGVPLDQIPTILFVDQSELIPAMRFIKHGILDVIPTTADDEVVMAKLLRIKRVADDKTKFRQSIIQELGTHGSLSDMNVVDLLEASRGNARPLQISISAQERQLTIITNNGTIIFAESDNGISGVDAIQHGLGWRQGVWSIDPIDSGALPISNVNKGIDSVLLEACVNYDICGQT